MTGEGEEHSSLSPPHARSEVEFRLPESGLYGRWLLVEGEVNIKDLLRSGPGQVIRMRNSDSLQYIPASLEPYDHIAGMISDAA